MSVRKQNKDMTFGAGGIQCELGVFIIEEKLALDNLDIVF